MSKILLIEDDPFVIEWVKRLVQDEFQDGVAVEVICSELEFLVWLQDFSRLDVRAIIVDLMLPWEDGVQVDPKDNREPRGDHLIAGTRIIEDLARDSKLQGLPILFYTVNDRPDDRNDFNKPPNLTYMRKDEPDDKLMTWIRRALKVRNSDAKRTHVGR